MLGLFSGAYFTTEKKFEQKSRNIKLLAAILSFEFLLTLLMLRYFDFNCDFFIQTFIFIHALLFGIIIGRIFTLVSFHPKKSVINTSSSVYGLDMIGAALGAIIIAAVIIPQFGIIMAVFILWLINSFVYLAKI